MARVNEEHLILLGEYGSVAQGTATADSDHDYMGIVIEQPETVIGLDEWKSARVSDAANGEKSAPGSSDTQYHTLRKFVKLAAAGNPTMGSILFLPKYEVLTPLGQRLLDIRDAFVSKKAGQAYLGYMDSQIKAFNETGRKNRAELVEQHGYDIKFGYHAFRLGTQGITMMLHGKPSIPLEGWSLGYAKLIRQGGVTKSRLVRDLMELREDLRDSIDNADLPDYPDTQELNKFLIESHRIAWGD